MGKNNGEKEKASGPVQPVYAAGAKTCNPVEQKRPTIDEAGELACMLPRSLT